MIARKIATPSIQSKAGCVPVVMPTTKSTTAAGSANGNTFPQVYDSMGRFIYLNLTARF